MALSERGPSFEAGRERLGRLGRAYAWMLPGLVLSWLAGGFQSGGWGLLTPLVFAGAARAQGLHADMTLWRLALHRAFSFLGIALGFGLVFAVIAAASLGLVSRVGLEGWVHAAAWFVCFAALSWWPLSRLWLAPALPFVVSEAQGGETFFTRLWSGPGLRASFLWTRESGPLGNGLVPRALIYVVLAVYALSLTLSTGGSALPRTVAFAMCFGLMPLTVNVWVSAARAVATRAARRGSAENAPPGGGGWIDSGVPLAELEPGAWVHAVRDLRAAGAGPPYCLILSGRRDDEEAAVRALVSEGQRHWGFVFRIVDFARRRPAPAPTSAPAWEAGRGDGLLLLQIPAQHAQARFYVAAAGAPRELEAGGALREAFQSSTCTALLAEIAFVGTCELAVAERVRHESGGLVRVA